MTYDQTSDYDYGFIFSPAKNQCHVGGPTGVFLTQLFVNYFLAKSQCHVGVLLRSLHCPSFGSTASGDRRAHGCTHSGSTRYTIYISHPGRIKVQIGDGGFQGGYFCFE